MKKRLAAVAAAVVFCMSGIAPVSAQAIADCPDANQPNADTLYACDTLNTRSDEFVDDKQQDTDGAGPNGLGFGEGMQYANQGDWAMFENVVFDGETKVVCAFATVYWDTRPRTIHLKLDSLYADPLISIQVIKGQGDILWYTVGEAPAPITGVHDLYITLDTLDADLNEDLWSNGSIDNLDVSHFFKGGFNGPHGILFFDDPNAIQSAGPAAMQAETRKTVSLTNSANALTVSFARTGTYTASLFTLNGTRIARTRVHEAAQCRLPVQSQGTYILRIDDGTSLMTKRVMITH